MVHYCFTNITWKTWKPGASTHPKQSTTSSISPWLRVTSALEVGKRPFFLVGQQTIGWWSTIYIYISISFSPMPNRQSKATILEVGNHRFFWCNSLPQPSDLFIIIVSQFPSDIPLPATLTSTSRWLALTIHCYAWPCLIYDAYDLIYDECNCVTWFLMIMILQPPFWMIHLYRFIYIYILSHVWCLSPHVVDALKPGASHATTVRYSQVWGSLALRAGKPWKRGGSVPWKHGANWCNNPWEKSKSPGNSNNGWSCHVMSWI